MIAADVTRFREELCTSSLEVDEVAIIEELGELELAKNAIAARQADLAQKLHKIRETDDAARAERPRRRRGSVAGGVAGEVALARRESGHRGQQHLGLARTLHEMPHTQAAFRAGRISEWRATIMLRETACLTLEDRQVVDVELAGSGRLETLGDGESESEAKKIAYRLDAASFVARRRRAEADRHVSLRPVPDVMTSLSALLPVKAGVAVYAALKAAAEAAVAAGDGRSRGQLMADLLVARVTGKETANTEVVVEVVVPDTVLTGQSDEACHVAGYGPVPADLARELARHATWLRRLYADAATGRLVAMESTKRRFPAGLAHFLRHRDRTCRMPFCDAPVRHLDHVVDAVHGGATSDANGQGLCELHNYAKQARGWRARPRPGPRHTVEITTPTGHTHRSTAPPIREPRYTQTAPGRWTLIA